MRLATTGTRLLTGAITRRNVRRHLARVTPDVPRLRVAFAETGLMPRDVVLERDGGTVTIVYDEAAPQFFLECAQHFVRAYIYWLVACPPGVRRMSVTGADGDMPTLARFAPSAHREGQEAIPDPHFFDTRGFAAERQQAVDALPWGDRSDDLVWRGGSNGYGRVSFELADRLDPTVLPRMRLVMTLRDVPGADARIIDMGQEWGSYAAIGSRLGFIGDRLPEASWLGRKYAIDVDGTVNTWRNLFIRLLYGCCVLKVESQLGFRQWYHERLRPFEHYVPVKPDMSDLLEQWEWAMAHDAEARQIAANGQALARELTFEQATADAVALITANWNN